MNRREQDELEALGDLMELLGVSEMSDEQWGRWVELTDTRQAEQLLTGQFET